MQPDEERSEMKVKMLENMDDFSCRQCSRCCTYFCAEVDEPETKRDYDDLAWMIAHENTSIHISDGDWQLVVHNSCRYLQPEGGCAIYDKRPAICREHVPGDCERDQAHIHDYDDVEHVFKTMDELWAYRDEIIRENRSEGAKQAAKTRKRKKREQRKAAKQAAKAAPHPAEETQPPCNEGETL